MNKREKAVIDAAFNVYSAWAYDAEAVGPFLPALFQALQNLDEQRAWRTFGEAHEARKAELIYERQRASTHRR